MNRFDCVVRGSIDQPLAFSNVVPLSCCQISTYPIAPTYTQARRQIPNNPVTLIGTQQSLRQTTNDPIAPMDTQPPETAPRVTPAGKATKVRERSRDPPREGDELLFLSHHRATRRICRWIQRNQPRALPPTNMGNQNSVPATAHRQPPSPKIKFRVLIIGRANAGKTSILQRVCDTTDSPVVYRENDEVSVLTILTLSMRP